MTLLVGIGICLAGALVGYFFGYGTGLAVGTKQAVAQFKKHADSVEAAALSTIDRVTGNQMRNAAELRDLSRKLAAWETLLRRESSRLAAKS